MHELPVIACSLDADELPERRRRWRALVERSLEERAMLPAGVRLSFRPGPGVEAELSALAALERDCCSFASFDVRAGGDCVTLDVTSAGEGVAAVRELFG